MNRSLVSMPRPAGAATDSASNALDEEDDETLIVTVQISRRLHPQLFDDVTRAKKRERAERLRWLCQYGLAAERQALMPTHIAGGDGTESKHAFAMVARRSEFHAPQMEFAQAEDGASHADARSTPSLVSHPDVDNLLL